MVTLRHLVVKFAYPVSAVELQRVEQLGLFCQRWSRRLASYRIAGEIFDPRRVSVEPIGERDAKAFVCPEH